MKPSKNLPSLPSLATLAVMGLALGVPATGQEKLSEESKKEAMEWVKQAKASFLSDSSSRIRKAEAALIAACASENAAMNLYVEAMKSKFTNTSSMVARMYDRSMYSRFMSLGRGGNNSSQSPSSMFSNWRKENTGSNTKPGLKKALQIHFKWLLLCLRKSEAEKKEQEMDVRANAMTIMDEYMGNIKEVAESIGAAAIASEVVKDYLDVTDLRTEKIPSTLTSIESVYEKVFFPPYKESKDIEGFRSIWQKRINSEIALLNAVLASSKDSKNNTVLVANALLQKQMERERQCYELGDEVQAINNLKKVIVTMRNPEDKQNAIRAMEEMLNGKKREPARSDRRRFRM